MIRFEVTGMVTAIPRASQMTTEFMRASVLKDVEEGRKVYTRTGGWEEPQRFGSNGRGRYTRIRIASEGEQQQTADFWIAEYEMTTATFEKLIALEVGDRVKLTGYVAYSNQSFQARPTHVRFLGAK